MIRFAWRFSASGPWWTCTSWNWGRLRRKIHPAQEVLEAGEEAQRVDCCRDLEETQSERAPEERLVYFLT